MKARVLEGGHNVADPIIEQRYHMGLTYLKGKLINFFEATLIDVSSHEPRLTTLLRKGRIVFKDPICPPWVQASLELAERLESRRRHA